MVGPIDTPGGAILTMVLPLGLFAVVAIWLYFRRNAYPARVAPAAAVTAAVEQEITAVVEEAEAETATVATVAQEATPEVVAEAEALTEEVAEVVTQVVAEAEEVAESAAEPEAEE